MPNTKQSNTATVDLTTVFFMKAFCRTDLTSEEITHIEDLFRFLTTSYLGVTSRKRVMRVLLSKDGWNKHNTPAASVPGYLLRKKKTTPKRFTEVAASPKSVPETSDYASDEQVQKAKDFILGLSDKSLYKVFIGWVRYERSKDSPGFKPGSS